MPSIRLADLAQQLDAAELHGDGDIVITGVASIQSAQAGDITFMVNLGTVNTWPLARHLPS